MVKPSRFVRDLAPYKITPQDVWSRNASPKLLKLDWNECPVDFGWYQEELKRIVHQHGLVAWYPDCLAVELNEAIASFVGINSNFILAFPGSDVGLETLCRAYLEPDDRVVVLAPTYENFFVYVLQTGAKVEEIVYRPPDILEAKRLAGLIESCGTVKAVYLARPNNPFGYMINSEVVEELCNHFPEAMFIVDEAYIEFSDATSSAILVQCLPNIVVARTFSKAFGMAGMRLGYLCAPVDVINTVNKIRNGKNVSMISQRLAIHALRNYSKVQDWIDQVRNSRAQFEDWCSSNGISFFPSQGNFVLFRVNQPNEVCSELKAAGIYVRNRNQMLRGCVRATMGSEEQVSSLTFALSRIAHLL